MKKVAVTLSVVIAVVFIASLAVAQFSVPTSGRSAVKAVTGGALQAALNKEIKKRNCSFNNNATTTTCDLKKLGNDLAAAAQGADMATGQRIYINITADNATAKKGPKGYARANEVKKGLQVSGITRSWRYSARSSNTPGNDLQITAEVR